MHPAIGQREGLSAQTLWSDYCFIVPMAMRLLASNDALQKAHVIASAQPGCGWLNTKPGIQAKKLLRITCRLDRTIGRQRSGYHFHNLVESESGASGCSASDHGVGVRHAG